MELRNKSGLILVITAFAHIICSTSELAHAYTILFDTSIERLLSVMALAMVFDVFLAISVPLWYKSYKTRSYLVFITIPALLYAVIFPVPIYLTLKPDRIIRCNTMMVISSPVLASTRFNCNLAVNVLVVVAYLITAVYFARKCKKCVVMKPVMKRVGVTALMYTSTWFIASAAANIVNRPDMNVNFELKKCLQSGIVLLGMICYSQNFYICIWRSAKYRRIVFETFGLTSKPTMATSVVTQRQYSYDTSIRT